MSESNEQSDLNVVDSSGWLEYFADGPNADFFAPAIEAAEHLIVPSLSILEVFKRCSVNEVKVMRCRWQP